VAPSGDPWRRVQVGCLLLALVLAVGTVGYRLLGLGWLDAGYQTVTTISTVGFRELEPDPDRAFKLFTIAIVLSGVGVAFYTAAILLETVVEGRLSHRLGRRRMQRTIADLSGHVVLCGWGRVGRSIARHLAAAGREVVVIESDPDRFESIPGLKVAGDATDDDVLTAAGVERAGTLVAAVDGDADNLFIVLSARDRCPQLFIVARVRSEANEAKLRQAGADRVVNPQLIGGSRMAALALAPNVADFLDVVMHDEGMEFRLADVAVPDGSPLSGQSLRDAHLRDRTGALVLAIRDGGGAFVTNPPPETILGGGTVLIAIGTQDQLDHLVSVATKPA
jgi:voltage-gated potassium channel